MCLQLGYHRLKLQKRHPQSTQSAQENLFWTVYKIEKGLSLRLGRSSNVRDTEITIACDSTTSSRIGLARIQGHIYDRLYSPIGLSRSENERACIAVELASDLRALIDATHADIRV